MQRAFYISSISLKLARIFFFSFCYPLFIVNSSYRHPVPPPLPLGRVRIRGDAPGGRAGEIKQTTNTSYIPTNVSIKNIYCSDSGRRRLRPRLHARLQRRVHRQPWKEMKTKQIVATSSNFEYREAIMMQRAAGGIKCPHAENTPAIVQIKHWFLFRETCFVAVRFTRVGKGFFKEVVGRKSNS